MEPYWIAAGLAWLVTGTYAIPGAFAAAFWGSERRGDPMRLAVLLISLVFVVGTARWYFSPEDQTIWKAVWIVSTLTALYVMRLMWAYGRGDPVGIELDEDDDD